MAITRERAYVALGIIGAVLAAWLVDRLISIEKRRIERTVDGMRAAAARADVEKLFSFVSADYRDETFTRLELRLYADTFFAGVGPVSVGVQRIDIARTGEAAVVGLILTARAESRGYLGFFGRSAWQLDMQKERDGVWRVRRVTPLQLGERDVGGWKDVPGHGSY